jgi:hypothetical protein
MRGVWQKYFAPTGHRRASVAIAQCKAREKVDRHALTQVARVLLNSESSIFAAYLPQAHWSSERILARCRTAYSRTRACRHRRSGRGQPFIATPSCLTTTIVSRSHPPSQAPPSSPSYPRNGSTCCAYRKSALSTNDNTSPFRGSACEFRKAGGARTSSKPRCASIISRHTHATMGRSARPPHGIRILLRYIGGPYTKALIFYSTW